MSGTFTIGDKVYEMARGMDGLSLLDMLDLEAVLATRGVSLADVEAAQQELKGATKARFAAHPLALLLTSINIWAARLAAGERLTFTEALSFPMSSFEHDPGDRMPPKAPKKKPKTATQKGYKPPAA